MLALIGAPIIGVLLLLFSSKRDFSEPYLFIVRVQSEKGERDAVKILKKSVNRCRLKSKTITDSTGIELIFDIRLKKDDTGFMKQINEMEEVMYSSLVSHDGNCSM